MNLDEIAVEVVCQWCARIQGYALASASPPESRRCVHCGGRIVAELLPGRPQDYGVAIPARPGTSEVTPQDGRRHCQDCGAPVEKARRCRRCYMRHRYDTQPAVKAKQLALQA